MKLAAACLLIASVSSAATIYTEPVRVSGYGWGFEEIGGHYNHEWGWNLTFFGTNSQIAISVQETRSNWSLGGITSGSAYISDLSGNVLFTTSLFGGYL